LPQLTGVSLTLLALCHFSSARASGSLVIPIEFKDGINFTTVRIGGVELKTVIDTGGWLNITIAPEIAAKLHVRFTGTVTESNNAHGTAFQGLREFLIPAMQLGGVTFLNVLGHERPRSTPHSGAASSSATRLWSIIRISALSCTRSHAHGRFAGPPLR
jgi:hypothetical protein